MSEQKLIDISKCMCAPIIKDYLDTLPVIDPENLPIVQELRKKLARYEQAEKEGRLFELPKDLNKEMNNDHEQHPSQHSEWGNAYLKGLAAVRALERKKKTSEY